MEKRVGIAVGIGVLNAVVVYINGYLLLDLTMSAEGAHLLAYKVFQLVGMFTIGAGSAYLFVRYKLVLPIVLAASFTTYSLYDHYSTSMEAFTPLYLGVWFVFAGFVATVAILECGIRRASADDTARSLG